MNLIWFNLNLLILLTLKAVMAVSKSDFGNIFVLMPSNSDWNNLVKDMKSDEIKTVVKIYTKPLKEFQEAARNRDITPAQLKKAFIAAVSLLQESAKNFSISAEEYQSSKDNLEPLLNMASTAFKLKRADDLAKIFSIKTLEAFSRQRLRHLLGVKKTSYVTYLYRRSSYENMLMEWKIIGSRTPKCKFRSLMERNLDLNYIEHMTALYLDVMRLKGKKKGFDDELPMVLNFLKNLRKDEMVKKIEALGNGYSTSKPPYSGFLIMITTFYALLITVMF